MALANNVHRIKGSGKYHARLRVPTDLQAHFGKKELWQTLGTTDPEDAKDRKARIIAEWRRQFRDLRRLRNLTEGDLKRIVYDHYLAAIEDDRLHRQALPTEADIEAERQSATRDAEKNPWRAIDYLAKRDAASMEKHFRAVQEAELRRHIAAGEPGSVEFIADSIIKKERLKIERDSQTYRDLCHLLQRAQLEALRRATERDQGDYTGTPADPAIKPPTGHAVAPTAGPGEAVMERFDSYARDSKNLKPDTLDQSRKVVRLFSESIGVDAPVSAIDKRAVREWKAALYKWPRKAGDIREFKGKTFPQIIEANKALGKPIIEAKTINRYLSALGGFCSWAVAEGHLDTNPVDGLYVRLDRSKRKVDSYDGDQLTKIFNSPIFKGVQADGKEHLTGNAQITDWRRWLPLLAIYSGGRLGELCQLMVADIRQDRGVWIMHITTEGDESKSTKTKGSQRVVPIHSNLIKCGFLDYHAAKKASGAKWLFPEIERNTRGQISGKPSRFFGRYFEKIGVKDGSRLNFHSFRHGVADALREAGHLDSDFSFILGHTTSQTGKYGNISQGDLERRVRLIESIAYDGLDLEHLFRS